MSRPTALTLSSSDPQKGKAGTQPRPGLRQLRSSEASSVFATRTKASLAPSTTITRRTKVNNVVSKNDDKDKVAKSTDVKISSNTKGN